MEALKVPDGVSVQPADGSDARDFNNCEASWELPMIEFSFGMVFNPILESSRSSSFIMPVVLGHGCGHEKKWP